jgi:hypothetical protein
MVFRNNPAAAQATNFARKDESQRQINRPKSKNLPKAQSKPDILLTKCNCCERWKTTSILK